MGPQPLGIDIASLVDQLLAGAGMLGGGSKMASHLLVTAGTGPVPTTSTLVDRDLHRPGDRRRCLLEHLALLRDALERSGEQVVRLEVGEEALQATGTLANHPE